MQHRNGYRGYHTKLTAEIHDVIIENAGRALTVNTIAKLVGVARDTLLDWFRRGREDSQNGIWTVFSQLSVDYDQKISEEIIKLIDDIRDRKKNWQACWELLKAVNREDFGMDALQFQQLAEIIDQLKIEIDLLKSNHGRGISNGKSEEEKLD